MSFWNGFTKKAQEILKWNALGGIEPTDPETIARAQQAELKTLAQDVEGANCANCKWSRPLPDESFLCNNPSVMMEVTERMMCSIWENPGSIFAGSGEDKANQLQQEQAMAESGEEGQNAQMDQVGQELGLDDPQQQAAGGEQPPAEGGMPPEGGQPPAEGESSSTASGKKTEPPVTKKPKKKQEDKKDSKKDGANTININVGGEKKAADFRGFLS